jgi:PadR family transcriptional regulator PadR
MEVLTINQLMVLSALETGEKYGLQIIRDIKETSEVKLSLGSLYNLMNSLMKKNFVEHRWGESSAERGGNRRKYYKITGLGQRALDGARLGLQNQWAAAIAV